MGFSGSKQGLSYLLLQQPWLEHVLCTRPANAFTVARHAAFVTRRYGHSASVPGLHWYQTLTHDMYTGLISSNNVDTCPTFWAFFAVRVR